MYIPGFYQVSTFNPFSCILLGFYPFIRDCYVHIFLLGLVFSKLIGCNRTSSIYFFISVCLFLCMPSVRYIAPGQINLYSWISLPAGQLRKINLNQFSPFCSTHFCSVSFFISRKIEKFTFHRNQASLFRSIDRVSQTDWVDTYWLIYWLIYWSIDWLSEPPDLTLADEDNNPIPMKSIGQSQAKWWCKWRHIEIRCASGKPGSRWGWGIYIVWCIVGTMSCVLKNIVKNIDFNVFLKTSLKHRIVKEKAQYLKWCF